MRGTPLLTLRHTIYGHVRMPEEGLFCNSLLRSSLHSVAPVARPALRAALRIPHAKPPHSDPPPRKAPHPGPGVPAAPPLSINNS